MGAHLSLKLRTSSSELRSTGATRRRVWLGKKMDAPSGLRFVSVGPSLGNSKWVAGAYPTPLASVHGRHERGSDGMSKSTVDAPLGVQLQSIPSA